MNCSWMKILKENVSIYINTNDKSSKERISTILSPFFEISMQDDVDMNCWKIISEDTMLYKFDRDNMKILEFDMEDHREPNRKYLVNPEEKTIFIEEPSERLWKEQVIIRLVRDISRNELLLKNIMYFHSGMVNYCDKGICFLGREKSGKTSAILSLLCLGGQNFISNDDLGIGIYDNEIMGLGWPRSISVRNNTFDALKVIGKSENFDNVELSHPLNKTSLTEKSTFFYPYEIAYYTKSKLINKSRIDLFIFTEFIETGSPRIEPIDNEALISLLYQNYEHDINCFFRGFSDFFEKPLVNLDGIENIVLSGKVRGYRIYQRFDRLDLTVKLINELVS